MKRQPIYMFVKRKREEKMKAIALTALAAAAGLATASPVLSTGLTEYTVDTAGTPSNFITVDVSGMQFNDAQGSPLNQILSVAIGAGNVVTGIAWNVNLTSIGASWASEAVMGFEGQINLTVATEANPVTNMNYDSMGFVDISDAGLPNITVGADGILDIEFFESFVDNGGTGDNFFEAGSSITLAVTPTPSSLAVLGLGGLVAGRRRR
jgi:MYXO-CTERM domain-containing protein